MPADSLQDHLDHAEGMARFGAHAKRLLRLQQLFQTVLPAVLRPHARIANLRLGKLVIHTTNSAVAAKIRQYTPRFTELLSKEGVKVTEIEVKTQALPTSPTMKKEERPAPPSDDQKQALTSLTQSLPPGSAMRTSLEALLRALKGR